MDTLEEELALLRTAGILDERGELEVEDGE
jgi:hypothetical protein